jgi:hypothetical protein
MADYDVERTNEFRMRVGALLDEYVDIISPTVDEDPDMHGQAWTASSSWVLVTSIDDINDSDNSFTRRTRGLNVSHVTAQGLLHQALMMDYA